MDNILTNFVLLNKMTSTVIIASHCIEKDAEGRAERVLSKKSRLNLSIIVASLIAFRWFLTSCPYGIVVKQNEKKFRVRE